MVSVEGGGDDAQEQEKGDVVVREINADVDREDGSEVCSRRFGVAGE